MSVSEHCPELATEHNGEDGWSWLLRSSTLIPAVTAAEKLADSSTETTFAPLLVNHEPYLLKSLPLTRQIERVGAGLHRRFEFFPERYSAAAECINTLQLERRLVPVPRVLAFGEKVSGLEVTRQAILFEAGGASRTLTDWLPRKPDLEGKLELLERAGALLESMFRAGFAQLNVSSDTIHLSISDRDHDRLTNLELVEHIAPRQQEALALVFALLFRNHCAKLVSVASFDQFAERQMALTLGDDRLSPWLDACYRYFKARDWNPRSQRRVARSGIGALHRYWIRLWANRHR